MDRSTGRIAFGTSGWRGRIADDFTFENVRRVAAAIADHVRARGGARRGLVVAYDTRFLSERFAETAAGVFALRGVRAKLCVRDTPTPVLSHEIRRTRAAGGINVTASHNPPAWNGIKFTDENGGPAPVERTRDIERRTAAYRLAPPALPVDEARRRGLLRDADPARAYARTLARLVRLGTIRRGRLRIVFDALHGTGRGYTDAILARAGCRVWTRNGRRDVLFGGLPPEPNETRLGLLAREVRERGAHLGLANDGDADRFGVVEPDGKVLSANDVLVLLANHLLATGRRKGAIVRTVATTHRLDDIAAAHGLPLVETPVGFKWIGAEMGRRRVLLGGEESGGLSVGGHVPEKDGILACLLLAEARAAGGPLSRQLQAIEKRLGPRHSGRLDLRLPDAAMRRVRRELPRLSPAAIGGLRVASEDRRDGVKWHLAEGAWLLLRLSGTEPLVRVYGEARSARDLARVLRAGARFVR